MSNSQMQQFSGRLSRIAKIHRSGGGFEAVGTLGQSHYTRLRLRHQRRPLLRPAMVFVAAIEVFKGLLIASIGVTAYAEKIAGLMEGSMIEKIGGFVLSIDPVALTIAQVVAPIFG